MAGPNSEPCPLPGQPQMVHWFRKGLEPRTCSGAGRLLLHAAPTAYRVRRRFQRRQDAGHQGCLAPHAAAGRGADPAADREMDRWAPSSARGPRPRPRPPVPRSGSAAA